MAPNKYAVAGISSAHVLMITWIACTPAAVGAQPIEAAPDDYSSLTLEELLNLSVATAGGRATYKRATAPANIAVINRTEIADNGWRTLAEALATIPGIYIFEDRVQSAVGVRGITGGLQSGTRLVKIMINGVPVSYRPEMSTFLGQEFIPIDIVERLEVAKGPLSSLYGANAFLATVNVITRTPPVGTSGELSLRSTLINDNTGYGGTFTGAHGDDVVTFMAAIAADSINRSGMKLQRTYPEQRDSPLFDDQGRRDRTAPKSTYARLQIESQTLGSLQMQGGLQQQDTMGEFQLNSILTHQSRYSLRNLWSSMSLDRPVSETMRAWARVGYSEGAPTRDDRLFLTLNNDSYYLRRFSYRAVDAALGIDVKLPLDLELNVGVDSSHERHVRRYYTQVFTSQQGVRQPGDTIDLISDNEDKNLVLRNTGVFAQLSGSPLAALPDLNVASNFRVDFNSLFENTYSWRFALAYSWSSACVSKLVGGQSFQAPSAVLLYGVPGFGPENNVVGASVITGQQPLRSQVVDSLELINVGTLGGVLSFDAAAYVFTLKDRIAFSPFGANFVARNDLEAQRVVGAELTIRANFSRVAPYANASKSLPVQQQEEQAARAVPDDLFPSYQALGGVHFSIPEAFIGLDTYASFVGERKATRSNTLFNNNQSYVLPAYMRWDACLSSDGLHILGANFETHVAFVTRNLLDERHSEPGVGGFDVPALGRMMTLELKQTF